MKTILERIYSGEKLVSDGAWGTFLHKKGLKAGECPEEWNISHPDDIIDIGNAYIKAGSDMIETNSFGASCFKLRHYQLEHRTSEINEAAARLSRLAAGQEKYVLGSIGPTGEILMMGKVSSADLYKAFREQSVALEKGGADAIIVETMSDLEEAVLAVKAAKENTACIILCTMTFGKTVDGSYKTMMGISPAEIPGPLKNAGADIIGSNCGNGTEGMIDILRELRKTDLEIPIIIQGNAGMPKYLKGITVFNETPEETAQFIPQLIKYGANIIGGCCGTTPEHIRKIADIVHSTNV